MITTYYMTPSKLITLIPIHQTHTSNVAMLKEHSFNAYESVMWSDVFGRRFLTWLTRLQN